MKIRNYVKILSLVIIPFFVGCADSTNAPTETRTARSVHTELGWITDADSSDDFIIHRPQYDLSYNKNLNVANWVAWNENKSWYGPAERYGTFMPDTLLPSSFTFVSPSDYTGSGYDRSHILGSEARTATDADNKATFYLTNIFPQTPTLNQQTWYSLEKYCDSLCNTYNKELYVVAGGVYKTKNRIKSKITIPDSCWKIVVVLDRGQKLSSVTSTTEVIAVMMNNGTYTTANNDWQLYTTTVENIEQQTGYTFFKDVPEATRAILKKSRIVL
ncbi:MAG: DNA/RNA non-specific endonuclease [Candidatus Kapabacteria bacterium]|nr:DNA/RNA non-specific endonuclease [Candidatus Kapabacteria bacterium]